MCSGSTLRVLENILLKIRHISAVWRIPVKVWLVLKSVSLPEIQQRGFSWRHHNTELIRRHAPGISVDLK